jgi:hypothetical protein
MQPKDGAPVLRCTCVALHACIRAANGSFIFPRRFRIERFLFFPVCSVFSVCVLCVSLCFSVFVCVFSVFVCVQTGGSATEVIGDMIALLSLQSTR